MGPEEHLLQSRLRPLPLGDPGRAVGSGNPVSEWPRVAYRGSIPVPVPFTYNVLGSPRFSSERQATSII